MPNTERFKQITEAMLDLYTRKNHDYGDSVHDTFKTYGLTSFLVRLQDKLNRARILNEKDALVNDEKIEDTLMDMANYSILALIELQKDKETKKGE